MAGCFANIWLLVDEHGVDAFDVTTTDGLHIWQNSWVAAVFKEHLIFLPVLELADIEFIVFLDALLYLGDIVHDLKAEGAGDFFSADLDKSFIVDLNIFYWDNTFDHEETVSFVLVSLFLRQNVVQVQGVFVLAGLLELLVQDSQSV